MVLGLVLAPRGATTTPNNLTADTVFLCRISGGLDEGTVALVRRTFQLAADNDVSHVILEIDTPGGEVTLMHRIIETIEASDSITSVALVDSKAASAGALIAISCDQLLMTPGSNIGSSRPIWMTFPALPGVDEQQQKELQQERDSKMEKIVSDFRATFRSKAQASDRNEFIAEAMVDDQVILFLIEIDGVPRVVTDQKYRDLVQQHGDRNVRQVSVICRGDELLNLTAEEAERLQFIDAVVNDRDGALALLGLEEAALVEIEKSWSEHIATWVAELWWVLLIAGILALFVEVSIPGFGVFGALGLACFAVLLFGKYLVGLAEMTELLLVLAGLILIATEIFLVPGFFVPGILGAVLLLAGIVLSLQTYDLPGSAPPELQGEWWKTLRTLGLSVAGGILGMFALSSILPRLPFARALMVRQSVPREARAAAAIPDEVHRSWIPAPGERGHAVTPLRPAGKIELSGRTVDAVTDGSFVETGTEIRVVHVEGNRIVVRTVDVS